MTKKDETRMQAIASALVVFLVVAAFMIGYNVGKIGMDGSTTTKVQAASIDGVAMKGDPNAPVTITEWSDFECPFCGRFYSDTLPQIEEQYIKTGKVNLVYKDYPLSFHPNAQKAAEAGKCALEQDPEKFWLLHDKIFQNQQNLNTANLKQWAAEIGLDSSEFNECLDSGRMASVVQAEMQEGQQKGVRGTPGFLVGDQLVSGAQPFAVFQQAIEAQLQS